LSKSSGLSDPVTRVMRFVSGLLLLTSLVVFALILSGASPAYTDHASKFRSQLNLCLRVLNVPAFMSEQDRKDLTESCGTRAEIGATLWGTASHAEVVAAFLLAQEGQPEVAAGRLTKAHLLDPGSYWLASLRVAIWDLLDTMGLQDRCASPAFSADAATIARASPSDASEFTDC